MSYPQRDSHFAHRFVRLLFKTCAAQEIGPDGVALLACIAHTEDAARYRRPVTYFNNQLMNILGIRKWDRLNRIRRECIRHGWLHYEEPPNGSRKAGRYFVLIPEDAKGLDDQPTDEGQSDPDPNPATEQLTRSKQKRKEYPEGFEEWYGLYPKKTGKGSALKAYNKAIEKLVGDKDHPDIVAPIDAHRFLSERAEAFSRSSKSRGDYCWNPATWLNGGHYDDDPATWGDTNGRSNPARVHERDYAALARQNAAPDDSSES